MTPASALSRLEKLAEEYANPSRLIEVPRVVRHHMQRSAQDFIAGGKAMLQIVSEPGEACGPRVWISKKNHRLVSGGNAPDASFLEFQDSNEYVSLAELLQARAALDAEKAALASSEARVRSLTKALEFYKALEDPFGNGTMAKIHSVYGRPTPAERILLEVQS